LLSISHSSLSPIENVGITTRTTTCTSSSQRRQEVENVEENTDVVTMVSNVTTIITPKLEIKPLIPLSTQRILNSENVSLFELVKNNIIKIGDKLVLINTAIYMGEVLQNGKIKLEWTGKIVSNLPKFTESCGIKYSEECWDIIWCNGNKLRYYIEQLSNFASLDEIPPVDNNEVNNDEQEQVIDISENYVEESHNTLHTFNYNSYNRSQCSTDDILLDLDLSFFDDDINNINENNEPCYFDNFLDDRFSYSILLDIV